MKKVLIIGSTVVDIIVNLVDSLPKTGEDVHIRSQHMSLGGCAYNVSDSVRHFQVPYILFSPVGQGVYGHFVREELKKRGISSPIPSPDAENGCCYCFVEKSGERSFVSYHGAEYLFEKNWFDLIDVSEIDSVYICGLEIEEKTGINIVEFLEKNPQLTVFFAPVPAIQADTIGAGDSHIGSVIACLKKGDSIPVAISKANRVSSAVVATSSALLPDEDFRKLNI